MRLLRLLRSLAMTAFFAVPAGAGEGSLRSLAMSGATLFLFSGCFETEFDFKTIVQRDGTVLRETHIDGRGAHFFKAPLGAGWQSKTWETQGEEALIASTYYHVDAKGRFQPHQVIPSDYELDIAKQIEKWGDQEKVRLKLAGINLPLEDHLFSRNRIKVSTVKGWLTSTTLYEEIFQNAGVIDVLLIDLKEEIRKQALARGDSFDDAELEQLARLRLVDEIFPEIRFRSEVTLPGKLVAANATRTEKRKAIWEFTLKDFENSYSLYTIQATSKSLRLPGVIFLLGMALFAFALVVLVSLGMHRRAQMKEGGTKVSAKKTRGQK